MNLDDLDKLAAGGGRVRMSGSVVDAAGESSHRVMIEGPESLVREALGESNIDILVEPGGTREDWERQFAARLSEVDYSVQTETRSFELLLKPMAGMPTLNNTVSLIIVKNELGGTSYTLTVPFSVGVGNNILVIMPFVCSAAGLTVPVVGDPDLFLDLSPFGPTVGSSILGGTAVDMVSHSLPLCMPFTGFVPFFRIFGFTAARGAFIGSGYLFP